MARITKEEFDLMHEAVSEWQDVAEKSQAKFLRDYGTDESKWDRDTVDLFNMYMDDWKKVIKAKAVVWETLFGLLKEVDDD